MRRSTHPASRGRLSRLAIVISAALLALVPIIMGTLLWRDRKAAAGDVLTAQSNLLIGLERDISRTIDTYDLALRAAASGLALLDGIEDQSVRDAVLFNGSGSAQYVRPILITNSEGTVLHEAGARVPRLPSVAGRSYLQQHAAQDGLGLLVGLEYSRSDSPKLFLSLTRRLNGPHGEFIGVVAGGITRDYFQNAFSRFKLSKGGIIALIGYDGRLLAGLPFHDEAIGHTVMDSLVQMARTVTDGHFETIDSVDGVTRLVSVRQLGSLPFFLAIGAPTDAVYAGWRKRAWIAAFVVVVFIGTAYMLMVALWRELARRQVAEQSARASEARIEAYFENLADGVLVAGQRADGEFVYKRINSAAARMLGIRAEDVIGRTPREVWPSPVAEVVESRWKEGVSASAPLQYQNTHDIEGSPRVLRFSLASMRAPSISGKGEVVLLLNSIWDATEVVEMEAQLRHSQRMDAVGQLTAGVAHDFNNMLQVQFGALELLMEEIADRPAALDYAAETLSASQHGSKLTHSLLAFSRQQFLAPEVVPPGKLLDMLGRMLSHTLGPRITLRVGVPRGTAPPFADKAQLEAALLNLALNARDAMPDGGTLSVEACNGELARSAPAGLDASSHMVLSVSDEGAGMSPEVKARVCEPFFTTKGVGKGSGLGLSMVHGFVQQSGGSMRILSAPGKGTRVELWLPKAKGAAPETEAIPLEPSRGWQGIRVLLVDDSSSVLVVTAKLLGAAGFDVTQASDGEKALSLLETEPAFDILVTDYAMPGIDGRELLERACTLAPGLPAIVITGFAEAVLLGRLPPHTRVVRKPISGADLARLVGETATEAQFAAWAA